jgi:hypothetical protein
MNYQIPGTNNQIMTQILMAEISKKPFGDWSLVIGYYLEFGV